MSHLCLESLFRLGAYNKKTEDNSQREKVDGAQFYFGVDASGGSRSKDPRTRLCRWGISAVALNATGEWHRVAWKSGLLPGRKQTVARAELYALVQLLRHTSGPISFSSDSQLNMKLFKRLVSTRRLRPSWSNLDLWHEVREALLQRWLSRHLGEVTPHLAFV